MILRARAVVAPSPQRQRQARDKLAQLFAHPSAAIVIHYACQSLDQETRLGSPRVTALAARNLETGETATFSIHAEQELARLTPIQVLSRLDMLERAMLDKLFAYLAVNRSMRFLHWNMRDATFGFAALEHRYAVLGGTPLVIPDTQKLDLARLMADIYGTRYVPSPVFEGLAQRNAIATDFLTGRAEAEAFERGQYLAVQRSVLAKVRLIGDVARLANDRSLKTDADWWTLNAGRLREAYELFQRNPVQALAGLVFAGVSAGFGLAVRLLQ